MRKVITVLGLLYLIIGYGLIVYYYGWVLALAVFLIQWGIKIDSYLLDDMRKKYL